MTTNAQKIKQKIIYLNSRTGVTKLLRRYGDWYETRFNQEPPMLPETAVQKGWSFVVITGGQSKASLLAFINSAHRECAGTAHEIIIVGPPTTDLSGIAADVPLTHISYREKHLWGIDGWITKKKNIGIHRTRYDKLVVSHDYVAFAPGWKKGFDEFAGADKNTGGDSDFTACTNIILNQEGARHLDWIVWDYPAVGQALIPYPTLPATSSPELNKYQYLNGTYFIIKRNFYLQNPLDNKLRAGEGEDIEWSKRIRQLCTLKINIKSTVMYTKPGKGLGGKWGPQTDMLSAILKNNGIR